MKKYSFLAFTFLCGTFMHAQTLESAIKKTENERFDLATGEFKALIAKEPTKADNYFYFGENYFQADNLDSAKIVWEKGLSLDPTSLLNQVGVGKSLWYAGDTAAANKMFNATLLATKNKNAEIIRQIGAVYVYAPIKNLNKAVTLLTAATKLDSKNIDGHLLLGDAHLELNPTNGTEAMKSYNAALDIVKSAKIIVRKAKVYQRAKNYELANDMYKEAQELDPTYAPSFRENAELNMFFNQSTRAIENWKKYLELNDSEYARYRYATSLFSGKKYCEAVTEFEDIHAKGFQNFYSERLLAYSIYECNTKDAKAPVDVYQKAMAASDRFFKIAPEDKVIAMDYKYRGLLLAKMGNDSLAVVELDRAVTKDPTNSGELHAELAKLHLKAKKYDLAIASFNSKMGQDSTQLTAAEYYDLGRAYYFGPKNYMMADAAYTQVAKLAPTYAMAYLWRGRSNAQLDPKKTSWAAKPHYEQFIETVPVEERAGSYKNFVIEAAKYLGDYYVTSTEKNVEKAKAAWTIVKELDPADKQAKAYFGIK